MSDIDYMTTAPQEISLDQLSRATREWADVINNFVNGFSDSYRDAYNAAMAAGKSSFEAKLAGLTSGIAANKSYAELNAIKAAEAGDTIRGNVFRSLVDHYGAEASLLSSQSISTQAEYDAFVGGLKQSAVEDLGRFGSSEIGRGLGKYLGPLFDLGQMANDLRNGDWDALGEDATSSLGAAGGAALAEALAMGIAGFLGLTLGFVPIAIIAGVGAVVGGLMGKNLWDSWHDRVTDSIEGLAGGIKDDSYRIVRYDPLAIDLDGDGLVGTAKENNYAGALFDNDGDGIRTATGWIGATDGLLVRDLNGNGTVDGGSELFGEQTVLADGSKAIDGFAALASLDVNVDGAVDATDAGFAALRIWRDANGNGVTDAGELLDPVTLGITSFAVAGTAANTSVSGGTLAGIGSFTKVAADGATTTGVMDDFNFANDTIHSQYSDHIEVPESLAALPDVQGLGTLRDLREASVLSSVLRFNYCRPLFTSPFLSIIRTKIRGVSTPATPGDRKFVQLTPMGQTSGMFACAS